MSHTETANATNNNPTSNSKPKSRRLLLALPIAFCGLLGLSNSASAHDGLNLDRLLFWSYFGNNYRAEPHGHHHKNHYYRDHRYGQNYDQRHGHNGYRDYRGHKSWSKDYRGYNGRQPDKVVIYKDGGRHHNDKVVVYRNDGGRHSYKDHGNKGHDRFSDGKRHNR